MAKDYAEMLRKAREGYAAATSGTTSGASKIGAKDYAKMLQDARNRVQGIQSNNDADAAQRASNERTVAARYYTNNLQYPGTVKKTPEQQSHDRVVYARQPAVQQQLKEHVDKLRAGMEFKQTDEYKTGLQNRMSGASLSRSLAQNAPVVAPIKADETPVSNTAPATEAREVYKEKQETPYLPGLRENSVAKQIGYLSEIAAAAVNLGAEDLKGGVKDLFNQITEGIAKGTETKQVGKVSLPSGIKKSTKPTFRTYSENQEIGLDDGSNLIKSMLKASEDAWYMNSDTEETPAEKRIAEIESKYKYTNKSGVTNFLASALSGTGYGTQNIAGSLVSGGGLGNPVSASMTLFKGIRRNMRDAKRMGYSKDDAVSYATQQTLADTGLDAILNAAGAGVEQVAGKAIANIPSVYARAAARTGVSALSEAAQSALSNIVSVANQKMTGNPDATIDWNSVARSAAVGGFSGALQQGIIEIVNLPTNARLAKRDYAVAEEYIKRATHVESDAEAEQMVQVGKKLLEYVDDLANEGTSESKARAKGWKAYKDTISAVVDDLENYGDRIVVDFAEKSDIVNNIINAPKADIVDGTADLVNKVAESIEPNENAVNATIDYIRDEIQKKQNEITMQTDPVLRRETEIDRLAIIEIEKTLRNKRAEIESARKKKLEEADAAETQQNTPPQIAETEKTAETSEKPLTTGQENATIPVENTAQEQTVAKQPKQEERVETPKNETTAKKTEPGNKNIQTFTVDGRTVEIDTSKRAPNEFTLKHVVKKHSKTGEDLDVYQIPKNLSSNEYARLKKNMVGIGGYYSSFVKGFIVPRDKIDRIEYFADVEEEAPAQKVDATSAPQQSAETVTAPQQAVENVENTTATLKTPGEPQPEQPKQQVVQETAQQAQQDQNKPASTQISDYVLDKLTNNGKITTQELQSIADKAHGGTMAEGKYDVKAMTDAMELGVNRYIIDTISNAQSDFNSPKAEKAVESLDEITESILNAIPTQTKRSEEQVSLQQFSTPPNIAYLASWVANIDNKDTVLEPSAGIGGLASFAKADGAKVYVNELSDSRLEMLKQLPFDGFFKENAEQINNILPDSVSPSVVLMNPPFSSTGGRTKNSTKNAIPHIEQALLRLQDGGRLVAIVGKGMADDTPTFRNWYNELREKYNIRANIGIDGENYKKYGTTFDVQLLVIDKTGPQTGETITGTYKDLHEIPKLLEGIRNDRSRENQQLETGESGRGNNGVAPNQEKPGTDLAGTVRGGNSIAGNEQHVAGEYSGRHMDTGDGSGSSTRGRGDVQSVDAGRERDGGGILASDVRNDSGKPTSVLGGESGRGVGRTGTGERVGAGERSSRGNATGDVKEKTAKKAASSDNGVYASYTPAKLTITGAKKHPAPLVESSAMSAVSSPELHYKPKLDQKIIDSGALSDAQLENISYAGQAHEQMLPNGERKGYFIGDGTGVGKGRQLAGIILDNFNQGRTKAVWVSAKKELFEDAVRDWSDLGGDASKLLNYSSEAVKKKLSSTNDGVLFVTYDTLKGASKSGGSEKVKHLDVIERWLGNDFDGVIVFDESHKMANLKPSQKGFGKAKASETAIVGDKFQSDMKNARVVYASATGATNVENLAYARRLGLWGEGSQFADETEFITKIGSSGIAAMELVARDMKAMGVYLARSISYDGVQYTQLQHKLTPEQTYMYNTMSNGWQVVLQNFDKAMNITNSKKNTQVKRARSQVYSNMQQFYNQVLSSMSMPTVISDIEKELAAGHSCVIQIVNTNEAAQDRAIGDSKERGDKDLENLDITPRQLITGYVMNCFPVQQYESYIDENGNEQSRPVVDSNGNPVLNKQAVSMRDDLLAKINDISIPEGPLDMLINHFGEDNVAEITGRKSRVVEKADENGNIKKQLEQRNSEKSNIAETKAFQDGKKRILVFSSAGGTGRSYHADKRAANQQKRIHYVLQPGWQASEAVQGFGRTHRSNQVDTPVFKLISTDVMGHKRFVTSIARRLDQLGALTKGQRQTGSGVFSEKDNLESPLSAEALRALYKRLGANGVEGINAKDVFTEMGLYKDFYDEYGNFKLNESIASSIPKFLNRILALDVEKQNKVFSAFEDIRQAYYEAAEEAGTLDTGMENVKADKLDIVQRETVYTDESTGAETQYVQAKVYNKPTVIQTLDDAMAYRPQFQGIRRMEDGSVRAVYRIADQTNSFGVPVKRFRLQGANTAVSNTMSEKNMNAKTEEIPKAEWEAVWKEAVKDVPEYNESELHMITGALLPVWNKLPQDGNIKAMRITATDGTQYLGRVIPPKQIDAVLRSLGASKSSIKKQYTGKELYSAVMDKAQAVSFDGLYGATWTVSRRRVSGENRLEVTGRNLFAFKEKYPGVFTETIQYKQRYFIPTGSKGEEILGKLAENGVRSVGNPEPDDVAYYSKTQGNWGSRSGKDGKLPMPKNISDIYKAAKEIFGIAINSGKVKNGAEGVYNTHANTIRTRVYGDLPTIAHELGHMFDKRYKLSDMESVNELVKNYKTDLEEAGYNESLYPKEAVAMYFADLLHDGEYAQQKNPQFSTALFDAMSDIDKNKLADFKQMTENYFRMDDKERRRAQVRYRYKDKSTMGKAKFQVESFLRDPKGYMGKRSRDFMREVFDDVYELRYFDGAHTLAMRERQSDSIAKGRLEYAFTDNHGKVIGKSLKSVLYEGNITDLNKKDFEAYLIARVALDRLENNEKDPTAAYLVYADKDLGSKEALLNAILDYERENPTFADTANGVYEYRHNLLTVAVDSGIISKKLAERMEKQLPHYVPLYRYVEDKNNVSPLAKFKGSGRDIYSPIENLATQTAAITKAIQKNETRKALFNAIDTNEDMGLWAEKVPPDKFFDRVSTQEIPDKIMKFLQSGGNGAMTDDDMVEFTEELMKYIGGSVGMWKIKNKQNDKIVSVMRNGVPEYYEMHDPGLLKALENMNPHKSNAFISLMGTATRISSTLVTSVSPRFGLFTNPIRDFYSGYIFSKTTNNPVTYTIDWFKAFIEAVRNTDDFKAYVANGGGYVGCITSKANVLRGIYKDMVKPSSKLKESINPRNWLESLSGLANAIDSAPRFAEYKRALEQNGGDVIAAVQEGMDITVNFRQSGRTTKEINNLVMFNSARVTAIGQNSERILKNRRIFAKWLTVNFLKTAMQIAALVLFSKMFDEGDEDTLKDYQNLSTYNKFANWCYPIGDGQFLRVPKEQNVMALSSVLGATWERFVLENPDAFKDMDEYLVDALMVADPNPLKAASDLISDVTFFGTVLDLAKNETFTGAPIVPNGYQYRAAPEQYNEKTSALAIKLGSITGMSPFQIDYIIDDTTGFVGDVILNLTKQGGTTLKDAVGLKDTSKKSVLKGIPVPGVVLRDSVYSTDVVSNFYDTKEGYDKRSGSYDAVGEAGGKYSFYDTYGSYKYQKIADVYSKANARLKLEKNDEAKRLLRRAMNTFIQSVNDTEKTKMDERISKLAENTGYTVSDIAPYIVVPDSVSGKMPDGVKVSYDLDGYDLLDYYTMSQLYFQYYCNDILNSTASDEEKAEALKKVKREVKEDLNDIFFEKLK